MSRVLFVCLFKFFPISSSGKYRLLNMSKNWVTCWSFICIEKFFSLDIHGIIPVYKLFGISAIATRIIFLFYPSFAIPNSAFNFMSTYWAQSNRFFHLKTSSQSNSELSINSSFFSLGVISHSSILACGVKFPFHSFTSRETIISRILSPFFKSSTID